MSEKLPEADEQSLVVNNLIAEYMSRTDSGEKITPEQFIAEHSDHAEELSRHFENLNALKELQQTSNQSSSATDQTIIKPDEPTDETTAQTVVRGTADSETSVTRKHTSGSPGTTNIEIPETFGRYAIQKVLGQGAMGAVYLAKDTQLDRDVALKIPKFGDLNQVDEEEMLARFYREARAAATLRSPNICPVYDVGEIDGQHYITMAYIEGRPLKDFTKSKKAHSEKQIATTIRKLAIGLAQAHKIGVVHRDLKPANIMVDQQGEPVVMDFGLARRSSSDDVQVTQSGAILGTPAYMSPEQVEGDQSAIGPPADIYALGIIMYELITGEMPFKGNLMSILQQIALNNPKKPSELRKEIDPRLEKICLKMMAGDLSKRYSSMNEVAADLQDVLKNPNRKQKKEQAKKTGPKPTSIPSANEESQPALISVEQPKSYAAQLREKKAKTTKKNTEKSASSSGFSFTQKHLSLAGGLAGIILLLGIVFIVRLGKHDVEITLDDPEIKLSIDGQVLNIDDNGKVIKLSAGEHKLKLEKEGLTTHVEEFTVSKDGKTVLKAVVINGKLDGLLNGEMPAVAPKNKPKPPEQDPLGPQNYALKFRGDQLADIPETSFSYDGSHPITIEGWIDLSGTFPETIDEGTVYLLGFGKFLGLQLKNFGNADEDKLHWHCYGANAIDAKHEPGTRAARVDRKKSGPTHIAMTYSGNNIALFVDGKLIEQPKPFEIQPNPDSPSKFNLGAEWQHNQPIPAHLDFTATFDEVRVSKIVRYTQDFTPEKRFPDEDDDTMLLYHFDEVDSDVLIDSSGNWHHGRIGGGTWVDSDSGNAHDGNINGVKWPDPTNPERSSLSAGLEFNSKNAFVDCGELPLDVSQPLTVELWFRPTALSDLNSHDYVAQNPFSFGPFELELNQLQTRPQPHWSITVKPNSGKNGGFATGMPVSTPLHQPVHIACQWGGKSGELGLWVDGKKSDKVNRWGDSIESDFEFFKRLVGEKQTAALQIGAASPRSQQLHGVIHQFHISQRRIYSTEFVPPISLPKDDKTLVLYRFDEGTGNELRDSSGNGHHGKIIGAKWVKQEALQLPQEKTALQFDGINDYVVVESMNLEPGEAFTVEAWIKCDAFPGNANAQIPNGVLSSIGPYNNAIVYEQSTKEILMVPGTTLLNTQTNEHMGTSYGKARIDGNSWTHLAIQTDESGRRFAYVNGKKIEFVPTLPDNVNQNEFANRVKQSWPAQNHLILGATYHIGALANEGKKVPLSFFRGAIREFRISAGMRYPEDFTPEERFKDDDPITKVLYHFDNGNGTEIQDASGNGHHGKIVGAKWIRVDRSSGVDADLIGTFRIDWVEEGKKSGTVNYTFESNHKVLKENNERGRWSATSQGFRVDFIDSQRGYVELTVEDNNLTGQHFWQDGRVSRWNGKRVKSVGPSGQGERTSTETSLYFSDPEDEVLIPTLKDDTDALTIEVWLQRDEAHIAAHSSIVGFDANTTIYSNFIQALDFQIPGAGVDDGPKKNGDSYGVHHPVHIAGVRDPEKGEIRLYHDGKLMKTSPARMKRGTGSLHIASNEYQWKGNGQGLDHSFSGWIDELRVSKSVRYNKEFTPQRRFEKDDQTAALYHFETGHGETLKDSSGNGHDGKIIGAKWVKRTENETPEDLSGLRFSKDSFVEIPTLTLPKTGELTLELFVKPTEKFVLRADVLGEYEHADISLNNGLPSGYFYHKGLDGKAALTLNKTHHLAIVRSKSAVTKLFVNGVLVANNKDQTGFAKDGHQALPFRIGSNGRGYRSVEGVISEVRLSTIARYDKDFHPQQRFSPDDQTLALYHFDKGSGDILNDYSGNGHDGKIVGAKWVGGEGANSADVSQDSALEFDGNSKVYVPNIHWNERDELTYEAFVKVFEVNHQENLVQHVINHPFTASLTHRHNGWQFVVHHEGEKGARNSISNQLPVLGQWVHLAGVIKGESIQLFVDGEPMQRTQLADKVNADAGKEVLFGEDFTGMIRGAKISKTARYDKRFDPPKKFSPDGETLALYHFDEGQGDILKDASGNGHDGKIIGAKWVKANEGSLERSLYFDGLNDFVITEDFKVHPKQSFTMELWVRNEGAPTNTEWEKLRKSVPPSQRTQSKIVTIGSLSIEQDQNANDLYQLKAGAGTGSNAGQWQGQVIGHQLVPRHGDWMHLAVQWDGQHVQLFINGVPMPEQKRSLHRIPDDIELSQFYVNTWSPYIPLVIGGLSTNSSLEKLMFPFRGSIREFRFSSGLKYKNSFTPEARFKADANTEILYHFETGHGETLIDSSGNGHHGKIIGAKWVKSAANGPANHVNFEEAGLQFHNDECFVDVPNLNLDFTKPFCLEAWCRPNLDHTTESHHRIIADFGPCHLKLHQNSHVQAILLEYSNGTVPLVGIEEPHEFKNHPMHIAMQWTGDNLLLFVDGVPSSEELFHDSHNEDHLQFAKRVLSNSKSQHLRIGNFVEEPSIPDTPGFFDGEINSLRVSQGLRYTKRFQPKKLIPDSQTKALYDFQEGTGDVLHDLSGNGYDGKIIGAKWVGRSPKLSGHALDFSNPRAFVTLSDLDLGKMKPFTLETVVTLPAELTGRDRQEIFVTSAPRIGIYILNDYKTLEINFADQSQKSNRRILLDHQLNPNEALHIATVFDGQHLILFLNGRRLAPIGENVRFKDPVGPPRLILGGVTDHVPGHKLPNALKYSYGGQIHMVRISNAVRYHNDFTPQFRFEPDSLTIGLYHFDEGTGEVLHDISGNGYDGKIVGAKWVKVENLHSTTGSTSTADGIANFSQSIDVIPLIDLKRDQAEEGLFQIEGERIQIKDSSNDRFVLPAKIEGAYRIQFSCQKANRGNLKLILPAHEGHLHLEFHNHGEITLMKTLENGILEKLTSSKVKSPMSSYTISPETMTPVEINVHQDPASPKMNISVEMDNKEILTWQGEFQEKTAAVFVKSQPAIYAQAVPFLSIEDLQVQGNSITILSNDN